MTNQVPPVICVACGKKIFFCRAVGRNYMGSSIKADDFIPLGEHQPPKDGEPMICPECGEPFALSNGKGGVVLKLDGDSWWPHPPF